MISAASSIGQPSPSAALTPDEIRDWERLAEQEWRAAGVPEEHILMSRKNGMDAGDIGTIARYTAEAQLLVIIRCPKAAARAFHRVIGQAKPQAVKTKSSSDGIAREVRAEKVSVVLESGRSREAVVFREREYTSDYDLLSVWTTAPGGGFTKLRVCPRSKPPPTSRDVLWRGAFTVEATAFMQALNRVLVARLQHGCQDDWNSEFNPGLGAKDHFTAFQKGTLAYLPDYLACQRFYRERDLHWPYDGGGRFTLERGPPKGR